MIDWCVGRQVSSAGFVPPTCLLYDSGAQVTQRAAAQHALLRLLLPRLLLLLLCLLCRLLRRLLRHLLPLNLLLRLLCRLLLLGSPVESHDECGHIVRRARPQRLLHQHIGSGLRDLACRGAGGRGAGGEGCRWEGCRGGQARSGPGVHPDQTGRGRKEATSRACWQR